MPEPPDSTLPFHAIVNGEGATVGLEAIEEAVVDGDLDMGRFTDEELHWLRDSEQVPDDDLEAPRLRRLDSAAQDAALDAVLTLLLARGDLEVVQDGEGQPVVTATGRHALLANLRAAPLGALRLRTEDREAGVANAGAYQASDRLVLLEEVDVAGVHSFLLTTPERAAQWLATHLDPHRSAATTAEPVHADTVADLGVDLDALAETAQVVNVVHVARANGTSVDQRSVTTYAGADGVASLQGWTNEDGGDVVFQRLGPEDVVQLAGLLTGEWLRRLT